MHRCNVIGGLLVFAFLDLTTGSASSLDSLVQNCSRQDEGSCNKLQKEMQHCKDLSECTSVLPSLPDSTLAKIAADTKTNQRIIDSANELLKKRAEEHEAKEAQERAIHDQRRANFSKLREGMTVAEVEAIIGPLVAQASFSSTSIKFADFVDQMRSLEGGEVHYTVQIRGGQVSMDSSLIHGGVPEKSLYTWDSDECRLVFDHTGKLQEFTYRGTP
jgi:hypothetical protein